MQLQQSTFDALKKRIHQEEQLPLKVVSDSMTPVIPVGAKLMLTKLRPEELERYDILVFKQREQLNCHFFWAWNYDGQMMTRSLKNPLENDLPCSTEDVLGKVTNFELKTTQKLRIWLKNLINRSF